MTGEVVIKALSYYDQGYDDACVREAALALVEEERRHRPTKNYLEYLPAPNYNAFETEMIKAEFERLQARLPMDMLSMKRKKIQEIIWQRKNEQTQAGGQLKELEAKERGEYLSACANTRHNQTDAFLTRWRSLFNNFGYLVAKLAKVLL
ncbi:hypothetical protein CHS0354_020903 [Potamilus streckersoni]|uniref:Pre-mRNA-splicing factor SPF27 n=1 Tax=Potamilus streckersoni TaxID=2493646 RepID=A0AAE0SV51_9BIVA|nr:hypothetical protein CHS0354_020903 [Potamilus streckersoni]